MQVRLVKASLHDQQIHTTLSCEEILYLLMCPDIVIIKQVFPEQTMRDAQSRIFAWSQEHPQCNISLTEATQSWHDQDDSTFISKNPHRFHGYGFVPYGNHKDDIAYSLLHILNPLRDFQNCLLQTKRGFAPNEYGQALRPQVIHYGAGGGFFARHTHTFEPGRIGMILGLSMYGRDFHVGGTRFFFNDNVVNTEKIHDIGDICLFRQDLAHEVAPIDPDQDFDWMSPRGRWSLVMPFI